MKISFSLAASVGVALILSLGGCGLFAQPKPATVSQKPAARQTPTYNPSYASYDNGQNVATSRLQNAPTPQGTVISSSPLAPAPAAPPPAKTEAKIKVAILLPLSGRNAALGQAMLNAAQQAVFDSAGANFELQPHDTAGGAEAAARAAVVGGAQIMIGPLFASDVPVVKAVVQGEGGGAGLQMLPLSTDTSLAEPGVYVMGLAPGAQVERVVAYAAAHGARRFAALLPATPYGSLVGQVFAAAVARQGGTVIAYESFDPAAHESAARVQTLAAQRASIDALFLPESGDALKEIAGQLSAAGFDAAHTHILGTGLWDVPDLGKQDPLLLGGWYAAPDPAARRVFVASYTAAYGQEPPRLATLAYDATALAAILAKHGGRYDEAALTNPNGFAGLDGIFRLLPSGVVERALAVDEVTADGAKLVDPAPTSFVIPRK